MRIISLMLSLQMLSFFLHGESNMMLEKANQFYHNKKYTEAIELYSQLLSDGYDHEVLYYNLGNAYYKTNKTGLAVWCYKKALEFNANPLYQDNLILAEKKIATPVPRLNEIFFMRWWHQLLDLFSSNGWAILGLSFFLCSMGMLVMKKLGKWPTLRLGYVWLTMVFCLGSVLFALLRYTAKKKAILIESVVFRSDDKALSQSLSEGIEVTIENKGRTQLLVSLPDGRTGSIPSESVREL